MDVRYDPEIFALSVEPSWVRPGETVTLTFRTRNHGSRPSPAGTVRFILDEGLEPLDDPCIAVPCTPPGDDVVAVLHARVAPQMLEATHVRMQAAFDLPGITIGSNVCAVTVRGRPLLDGSASGVWIEAVTAERVRVCAAVTNEGDGPARDVRIVVPAPAGTRLADGADRAGVAQLEPGETLTCTFDAIIEAPSSSRIAARAAYVACGSERYALPSRAEIVLRAVIAAPTIALVPARRRVEIIVDLPNDGWADAWDATARLILPAALRVVKESIALDGILLRGSAATRGASVGRFMVSPDGVDISIRRIPARESVRLTCAASVPASFESGTIALDVGSGEVTVAYRREHRRDVRIALIDVPDAIAAHEEATIVADLVNAGDVPELLQLDVRGDVDLVRLEHAAEPLAPGTAAVVRAIVRLRDPLPDGTPIRAVVVASDEYGERARTRAELSAVNRPWLALTEPPHRVDDAVVYVVRNAGTTLARDIAAALGDASYPLEPIAPGGSASLRVRPADARVGGSIVIAGTDVRLLLPAVDDATKSRSEVAIESPPSAIAGTAFRVRLRVHVPGGADVIIVRSDACAGAAYVRGSTTLDGRPMLDAVTGSPIDGEGLVVRSVPPKSSIVVEWSLVALGTVDALAIGADVTVDGDRRLLHTAAIAVSDAACFGTRPAGVAYYADACTLPGPAAVDDAPTSRAAATAADPSSSLRLILTPARRDQIARAVRGSGATLVSHLLALRACMPDGDAFSALREAVRDTFDRLAVKLRIPGFDLVAADLDSKALRAALLDALGSLTVDEDAEYAALRTACCNAPYGDAAALRALVALVPVRCAENPRIACALAGYAAALDDALCGAQDAPQRLDEILAADAGDALDEARGALLDALHRPAPVAGAA